MHDPADLFRALSDTTRLKMLALIRSHGELCVCDLENVLGITQSKASRHLRYLSNAGLLKDRREAVWMYYGVADRLTAAQLAVLDSVPELLDPKELRELQARLKTWLTQKSCGLVKPKPANDSLIEEVS